MLESAAGSFFCYVIPRMAEVFVVVIIALLMDGTLSALDGSTPRLNDSQLRKIKFSLKARSPSGPFV